MSESNERLLRAIQTIESELAVIKRALADPNSQDGGVVGTFDGEHIQLEDGSKYPIPPNYASKSMLVPGDTLRMIIDPQGGDQHRFKQIAKVERGKATGLLTRKDGKYEVICEEGSFKVLTAAIKHFEAESGDYLMVQFAKNHPKGSWAAIEKVVKAGEAQTSSSPTIAQPLVATVTSVPHFDQLPVDTMESTSDPMSAANPAPISASAETSPTQAPAATKVSAGPLKQPAKPAARQKSKSGKRPDVTSKPSSSAKKRPSSSHPSKPAATPVQPQPATVLSVQQGEIPVPLVMDDDDLT
jgi:hypothetical protein